MLFEATLRAYAARLGSGARRGETKLTKQERIFSGERMQILGISGSLRAASTNTSLLNAAAALAPKNIDFLVYRGLGDLPHFNPDLDHEPLPAAVKEFRFQLLQSAGVIISSPEYAHGVPGVLKNALDWLVASGELYEKPVALFSASPRATYAHASLMETLTVMTAKIASEACVTVPLLGKNLRDADIIADSEVSSALRSALTRFEHAIISSKVSHI